MGITCGMVGGLLLEGNTYYEGAEPCGKVSKGSCYNAKGDHSVECNMAEADCTGSWYKPGFVSGRSGCCHCEGSCPSVSDKCTHHDAPKADDHDDHAGHDHDDHDDHDDDDHDDEAPPQTTSGSVHVQFSSALFFGTLLVAFTC